jgi:uncharacterized protein (DUF1778 family)
MSSSRAVPESGSHASPPALSGAEARPGFRSKTISTRLSAEEVEEVEAAAQRAGQSLAQWLRETVLREARQRSADPTELLLSEVAATRYLAALAFPCQGAGRSGRRRPAARNRAQDPRLG